MQLKLLLHDFSWLLFIGQLCTLSIAAPKRKKRRKFGVYGGQAKSSSLGVDPYHWLGGMPSGRGLVRNSHEAAKHVYVLCHGVCT